MNVEGLTELEPPFFVHSKKLAALELQLYGHVRAAIDLDALWSLEEHLTLILMKEMPNELAFDMSTQIIEAALRRVIDDPSRHMDTGAPDGITDEEKAAVAFDESCQFCLAERQQRERAARAGEVEEEYCECCAMLRDSWREEHAEVLAKAGLARPSSASAIAGAIEIAKRDRARRDKPS